MSIKIHDRDLRGRVKGSWLQSWHTFSFGHFHDPKRMGFRALRVINEDIVIPGGGFPTHPHDNMEIITYILDGALEHKDSMGTGSIIRPGEIQKMSAGTGVTHSEFNASNDNSVHLLQIWIKPDERDVAPDYQQKTVRAAPGKGLIQIAGREETDQSVSVHQDMKLFSAKMEEGEEITYDFAKGRYGFLQIVRGAVSLNGEALREGDGAELSDVGSISLKADADSEILLFDLG